MPIQFPTQQKRGFWDSLNTAHADAASKAPSASESMARRLQLQALQDQRDGIIGAADFAKLADNFDHKDGPGPGIHEIKTRDGENVVSHYVMPRPKSTAMEDFIKAQLMEKNNLDITKSKRDLSTPDPAKEPKQNQFDAARFGRRMELAEKTFTGLEEAGYDPGSYEAGAANMLPFSFMKPETVKSARQAQDSFINAALRDESGASIAPHEREAARAEYFPVAGDKDDIKAQKRSTRQQTLAGLRAEAGNAWERVAPQPPRKFTKEPAKTGATNAGAKTEVKRQQNKKTGQIKIIYSDGTEEIING